MPRVPRSAAELAAVAQRLPLEEGPVLTATTNTIGQYILIPTGWLGPGSYGTIRSYLEAGLAEPIESPMPDAP